MTKRVYVLCLLPLVLAAPAKAESGYMRDGKEIVSAKIASKCFGKDGIENLVTFSTFEWITTLCEEIVTGEQRMTLLAELARFQNEDTDCKKANSEIRTLIREPIAAAYKKDGEEVFCKWAKEAYERKSDELFDRFRK